MPAYLAWVRTVPRAEQFTSAVVVGELFKGAYRSGDAPRHLRNIETRVLSAVTVLSYDVGIAKVYGGIRARLEDAGRPLADADLQIAATRRSSRPRARHWQPATLPANPRPAPAHSSRRRSPRLKPGADAAGAWARVVAARRAAPCPSCRRDASTSRH